MGLCGFIERGCNHVECCRDCNNKKTCEYVCCRISDSNFCGWYIQTSESFIKDQQKQKQRIEDRF